MHSNGSTLMCERCTEPFMFTLAEQAFRRDHNLPAPLLCPGCRAAQRNARHAALRAGSDQEDAPQGVTAAGDGAARRRGGAGRTLPSRSYPATCASCGAETRVPFLPQRDRPVFCRDCFNARRGR